MIIRESFVILVYRIVLIELKGQTLICYIKLPWVLSEFSCIQEGFSDFSDNCPIINYSGPWILPDMFLNFLPLGIEISWARWAFEKWLWRLMNWKVFHHLHNTITKRVDKQKICKTTIFFFLNIVYCLSKKLQSTFQIQSHLIHIILFVKEQTQFWIKAGSKWES